MGEEYSANSFSVFEEQMAMQHQHLCSGDEDAGQIVLF